MTGRTLRRYPSASGNGFLISRQIFFPKLTDESGFAAGSGKTVRDIVDCSEGERGHDNGSSGRFVQTESGLE